MPFFKTFGEPLRTQICDLPTAFRFKPGSRALLSLRAQCLVRSSNRFPPAIFSSGPMICAAALARYLRMRKAKCIPLPPRFSVRSGRVPCYLNEYL